MTKIYIPLDMAALAIGADKVAAAIAKRRPRAATRSRSSATARAACSGSSPWSRSRRRGPDRLWAGRGQGRRVAVRRRLPHGRRACALRRQAGRPSLHGAPDPPHLRALRHHRSAVARRLCGAWRLARAWRAPSRSARRRRSTKSPNPACAAAAAPAFRPASNGRRSPTRRRDRRYVVCNADEGDSGTFADRMIMEGDPLRR